MADEAKKPGRPRKPRTDSEKYNDDCPVDTDAAAIALLESSAVALGIEQEKIDFTQGSPTSMPDFDNSPVGTPKQTALDLADLQVQSESALADAVLLDTLCEMLPKDQYLILFKRIRWNNKIHESDVYRIMQTMASRTTRECHNLLRHNAAIAGSVLRTSGRGLNFGVHQSVPATQLAIRYCQEVRPKARKESPPQ